MGRIIEMIQEFNDAWDSGDKQRFEEVVRRVFAPDAIITRPEEEPVPLEQVLPLWLVEIEAWNPQTHVITNTIEGEDVAVWEYDWTATHNALLKTTDGKEFPASGRVVRNRAGGIARWNGEQIVEAGAIFSNYQDIVRQLEADDLRTA